jgi:ribosomal peptide maturation radical SAM protein 1
MNENHKVIILVPPFADPASPVLGASLLLSECLKENIKCQVLYTNLIFTAMVGYDIYKKISYSNRFLIGDALFAPYAFNINKNDLVNVLFTSKDLVNVFGCKTEELSLEEYLKCDRLIPDFLDLVVNIVCNEKPAILGISSVFEQNSSSVAIAKYIKKSIDRAILVVGGSNVSHPMGKALLEIAPMIDYCFSGEADVEFPLFCKKYFEDETLPRSRIIHCSKIDNLELAEIPNYDDYFQQVIELQHKGLVPDDWPRFIPFESSRGCWWGAKSPCAFCGLNTTHLTYRQKTNQRILKELNYLKSKYGINYFNAVDNIMPKDSNKLIIDLANLGENYKIYYSTRSDIKPALLDNFVKGGVVVLQVGVESLSSNILRKMGKGVTALQNLKLLREARSRQICLAWNFMMGVPGELERDYDKILEILPLIEHFQPPYSWGILRIDRYSPYFDNSIKYGISNIRPFDEYKLIYPPETDIDELAYHFYGDYESILSINSELCKKISDKINKWLGLWQDYSELPILSKLIISKDTTFIKDTRSIAQQTFTALDNESFELLGILNEPTRDKGLPVALRPYLPELLERKFVTFYEDHYISLVTNPQIGIDLCKQKKFTQL